MQSGRKGEGIKFHEGTSLEVLSYSKGPELLFAAKFLFQRGFFILYMGKVLVFLQILLTGQISRTPWHRVNSA